MTDRGDENAASLPEALLEARALRQINRHRCVDFVIFSHAKHTGAQQNDDTGQENINQSASETTASLSAKCLKSHVHRRTASTHERADVLSSLAVST